MGLIETSTGKPPPEHFVGDAYQAANPGTGAIVWRTRPGPRLVTPSMKALGQAISTLAKKYYSKLTEKQKLLYVTGITSNVLKTRENLANGYNSWINFVAVNLSAELHGSGLMTVPTTNFLADFSAAQSIKPNADGHTIDLRLRLKAPVEWSGGVGHDIRIYQVRPWARTRPSWWLYTKYIDTQDLQTFCPPAPSVDCLWNFIPAWYFPGGKPIRFLIRVRQGVLSADQRNYAWGVDVAPL